MPVGLYAKHEAEIVEEASGFTEDITKTKAFRLLRDDPDSKLIVNCGYSVSIVQSLADDIQFTAYDQILRTYPLC